MKQLERKKENLSLPSSTLEGILTSIYCYFGASLVTQMVKNTPAVCET